jgi:hypothetical protein
MASLALVLAACGDPSDTDASSIAAADVIGAASNWRICLVPGDHPVNGNGDVWIATPSAVTRARASYGPDVLGQLDDNSPAAAFTIADHHDDGYRIRYSAFDASAGRQLHIGLVRVGIGASRGELSPVNGGGEVVVLTGGQRTETIQIVQMVSC